MKKNKDLFIMLGAILLLGFAMAALWGRVSSLYLSLEVCAAVLFTVSYFFGAFGSGNNIRTFGLSVGAVGVPAAMLTLIVRADSYFGYGGGKLTAAAFLCGGIIFLMIFLSRHETGPLRAALGRNMLPAFFLMAAFARLIPYFKDMAGFSLNFKDKLCFDGVLFLVFAIGVFIGANRSRLADLNSWLGLVLWSGVFGGLLWAGSAAEKDLVPILFA